MSETYEQRTTAQTLRTRLERIWFGSTLPGDLRLAERGIEARLAPHHQVSVRQLHRAADGRACDWEARALWHGQIGRLA